MKRENMTAEERAIKRYERKESAKKIAFSVGCFAIVALMVYINSLIR